MSIDISRERAARPHRRRERRCGGNDPARGALEELKRAYAHSAEMRIQRDQQDLERLRNDRTIESESRADIERRPQ